MEEPIQKKRRPPSSPVTETSFPKPSTESIEALLGSLAKISLLDILDEMARSNNTKNINEVLQYILLNKET